MAAVPLINKTANTVTRAFENNILSHLPAIPTKILSDNGPEFKSDKFNQTLDKYGVKHLYTTPYKPSSNGLVERCNRTVIQLLKGLIQNSPTDWDNNLSKAVIIYNNTTHSEVNMSPSQLLLSQQHIRDQSISINSEETMKWKAGNPRFLPLNIKQR